MREHLLAPLALIVVHSIYRVASGGSRIFLRGVRQLPKVLLFWKIFAENCPVGARPWCPPPIRQWHNMWGPKPHPTLVRMNMSKRFLYVSELCIWIILINVLHTPVCRPSTERSVDELPVLVSGFCYTPSDDDRQNLRIRKLRFLL